MHSRNGSIPRLLRVTKSRDQVGVQPSVYAWYHFADVKNSKLFLLGFVRFRASQPNGLGCSEVTSLCGVGCLRNFVRNKAFLISEMTVGADSFPKQLNICDLWSQLH